MAGLYEFNDFIAYRINRATKRVKILVEWAADERTWEPEEVLQETAGKTLYEYWDSLGGREEAAGLSEFHVFRIVPKETSAWVGYPNNRQENSWETVERVRRIAPRKVREYERRR
ncbi:uncharacterized protein FOBCDRAFT_126630 [Fusarium oxysporum Fo47]|uniref:uncharacterized protein n=1 Tax=Fusarium oxysporum Fo47 TaxID=660027 RepID=UPI002869CC0B|nr:uncharacterized protein FOBCDRAFT_126630 [Fusarium oxysporum Fo47]QKD48583.2 hypothetical protein FOBCDRAFT_126630 [Fusarium oxysporum Fo47]